MTINIGDSTKWNGKNVFWAGNKLGWQSRSSYLKLKEDNKIKAPVRPPEQSSGDGVKPGSKQAKAILRRLGRQAGRKPVPFMDGERREIRAVGIFKLH